MRFNFPADCPFKIFYLYLKSIFLANKAKKAMDDNPEVHNMGMYYKFLKYCNGSV